MVENRWSERMRSKCTSTTDVELHHSHCDLWTFRPSEMKWRLIVSSENKWHRRCYSYIYPNLPRSSSRILAMARRSVGLVENVRWDFSLQDLLVRFLQVLLCWSCFWVRIWNWLQSIGLACLTEKHWIHWVIAVQTEFTVVSSARTSLSSSKV